MFGAAVAIAALATGCGAQAEEQTADAGTTSAPVAEIKKSPAQCKNGESAVSSLPATQQKWYEDVDPSVSACVSPYARWLEPLSKPPWKIAFVGNGVGNTWRQVALNRIKALTKQYQDAGLIEKLTVTDANGDSTQMIQLLNQAVSSGADAIITISPPETGINGALKQIYEKKIPFVAIDGDTSSPYYIATGGNLRQAGADAGRWLAEKVKGKGTVLAINGIPGITASQATWNGAKSVLDAYPDIKLMGGQPIYGQYTESVAKTQTLQTLSTNPEKLDGVFVQGSMEMAAINAIKQSGRPSVPVTFGGATNAGAYWRDNPKTWDKGFVFFPPTDDTSVAFDVMMRTLQGQGPKITSMTRPPVTVTHADLADLVPADATLSSTAWMNAPAGKWWTPKDIDAFFQKPADPMKFRG